MRSRSQGSSCASSLHADPGGLCCREWFSVLARQMFNPGYALFQPQAADALTYQPNKVRMSCRSPGGGGGGGTTDPAPPSIVVVSKPGPLVVLPIRGANHREGVVRPTNP